MKKQGLIIFMICLLATVKLTAQELFTGVWQQGNDGYALLPAMEWGPFNKEWSRVSKEGLRLVDIETYSKGGKRYYLSVWRKGSDRYALLPGMEWAALNTEWTRVSNEGLRLTDIETYTEGGKRYYLSVWREGNDRYAFLPAMEWGPFNKEWSRVSGEGLRLTDIETYAEGGKRFYLSVWRQGNDRYALLPPMEWGKFEDEWRRVSGEGMRLSDVETYDEGGKRYYISVWRAGNNGHTLWSGGDWENFNGKWAEYGQTNLRLSDIETYESGCNSSCLNHVLQPYSYTISGSSSHCEGVPGSCPTNNTTGVTYQWPAVNYGGSNYVRHSALDIRDQLFTLPFKVSSANMNAYNGWQYKPGSWHHALDYSSGTPLKSFEVCAAAPGTIIHMGWDDWSGNTIIISHDVGNRKDVYRTIYMHLRNGPGNDCNMSWARGVPASGNKKNDYKNYLINSGCKEKASERNPKEFEWGSQEQRMNMSLWGKTVKAGDVIGWAGSTGPGGFGGNHLHIFFAHKDPADNHWYFFDPFGIYADYSCYPQKVDGSINMQCVRYPVAWKNGKPGYAD